MQTIPAKPVPCVVSLIRRTGQATGYSLSAKTVTVATGYIQAVLTSYRNPSAKAPVIHPGDEVPFLVWGGEGSARRCLTEGIRPAMIRIDVLP